MMYYILFGGQQAGPFDLEQLKQMVVSQEIRRDTSISVAGSNDWIKADNIEDLTDLWIDKKIPDNYTPAHDDASTKEPKKIKLCNFHSWENIVGLIGGGFSLLSTFLPFVSIQFFGTKVNVTMIEKPDGVMFFALSVVVFMAILFRSKIGYMIISSTILVLGMVEYWSMINNARSGDWDLSALINKEVGFYLFFAGSIALLVSAVGRLVINKKNREKDRLSDLSHNDLVSPAEQHDPKGVNKKTFITLIIGCALLLVTTVIYFAVIHLNDNEKALVATAEKAINDIGTVNEFSGEQIKYAENIYTELSPKCKWHVHNHEILNNARSEYDEIRSQNVEHLIDLIGTVSLQSESAILIARTSYDSLEDQQKSMVDNFNTLNEAEFTYDQIRADKIVGLIDQLNDIDRNSGELIRAAQSGYDDLSDTQKELVSNFDILEAAPEQYRQARAFYVADKIDQIGKVTETSELYITAARSAYNELDESEKVLVENYGVLEQAEADIRKILVYKCSAYIDDIGEVSRESGDAIALARNAYNHLDQTGKDQVTNYVVLTSAESTYDYLTKLMQVGETDSGYRWDITLSKVSITNKILPNKTTGIYWYKSAPDGSIFLDLVFTMNNKSQDTELVLNAFGGCNVIYGGISYSKSYFMLDPAGSSLSEVYSWDGLGALNSKAFHLVIMMPKECQTDEKNLSVHLEINGRERIISFKN